ncbi:hypothetical protein VC83_09267 [Pseudogymnoascus destructans]|uniref:Uncharacterized protein n=1 Tax=Pseudogymnoascus destructans TaxID=655981 RepID=A0A176ZZQ2_9PEZI|nr:uncharacterized protein VC83_09267 [Pseudogymnoascus destructans]OAF54511.1 hypothetical protein VC83_09267 [Pseudogymnoascus destructans]
MPAVGQVFVEDLSEVFVDANIHIYLPPAAQESLPRPLPMLAPRVYMTVPYGTTGNVRLEHPQEIEGFYIQAAGENVARVSQVSMGCEQCDAACGEEGSRQIPFFTIPPKMIGSPPLLRRMTLLVLENVLGLGPMRGSWHLRLRKEMVVGMQFK